MGTRIIFHKWIRQTETDSTKKELETAWRILWSGSGEFRSVVPQTDLKGLNQGRCSEGRAFRDGNGM